MIFCIPASVRIEFLASTLLIARSCAAPRPAAEITINDSFDMPSLELRYYAKRLIDRFGLTVTRTSRPTLRSHLQWLSHACKIDCVLDVGAHEGEYRALCRDSG